MATNYGKYDKLKGKEVWGLPICLALAAGLLIGGIKYCNNYKGKIYENQKVRVVQNHKGLERLANKY